MVLDGCCTTGAAQGGKERGAEQEEQGANKQEAQIAPSTAQMAPQNLGMQVGGAASYCHRTSHEISTYR